MRWFNRLLLVLPMLASHAATAATSGAAASDPAATPGAFIALCYHEVRDDVRGYADPYAVDAAELAAQFAWLHGNGYTPVSLGQIVQARQGGKPLPAKAVLLTFDDSYFSFYTRVYPLLREYHFPAVLAVVGAWIDTRRIETIWYGEKSTITDASFPTWGELREMAASGLVEIASHSYDLHRGVPANPQGNLQPAATARIFDAATGAYEDDASWRARVRADLARNMRVIERETGHRPRTIVWPYGSYNEELVRMAEELDMPIALTLEDGVNTANLPLTAVRRTLIVHNPALADFIAVVRGQQYPEPVRVVQVALDDVYDQDPAQQEHNLSALLDRIEVLKPTHVYLKAFADTDGDGVADALYFPNRHLPMRADLFNRVAWQLVTRDDVKVSAVLPVTAFRLPQQHPLAERGPGADFQRLPLFEPEMRTLVSEIYEDLARYASFDGITFYDEPHHEPQRDELEIEFTQQLAARVRMFRAPLSTARNLVVEAALNPEGEKRFARTLAAFAEDYDQVALMAMPVLEGATDPDARLAALIARVERMTGESGARRKVVFMLHNQQKYYSRAPQNLPGEVLARQMRALQLGGALNFGYYTDDFLHDRPSLARIAPAMSLRIYPR